MKLPDSYAIRLIDLPPGVGEQIREYPDGHVDIFVNAGWGIKAQREAVAHAFEHWANDDFHNSDNIQEVEKRADRVSGRKVVAKKKNTALRSLDGNILREPCAVFNPKYLSRIGKTLYMPTGPNVDVAVAALDCLSAKLMRNVHTYDVLQTPPLVPASILTSACSALNRDDIAFVGFAPASVPDTPAVLCINREIMTATIYFLRSGEIDGANALFEYDGTKIFFNYYSYEGKISVSISRFVNGSFELIYKE